ncbi:hypothetical protein [Pseudomonas sp. PLMAX]|uniref:hypothetical protein n=1 Tax=Pseudomonas sp. PLMAX TaxID=2201998 RepID=UPI0038BC4368
MTPNWKKIADDVGTFLLGLIVLVLLYLWIKPILENTDYGVKTMMRSAEILSAVHKKDEKALAELEKLSFRDDSIAFIGLNAFYREQALQKAGLNLEVPNATFDSVDLSKPNALILRGIDQLSDLQLLHLLKRTDYLYDEAAIPAQIEESGKYFAKTVKAQNELNFHVYNSFDQATKDNLKACKAKLEEKLGSTLLQVINFHSVGTCTDNPPTPWGTQVISRLTNW